MRGNGSERVAAGLAVACLVGVIAVDALSGGPTATLADLDAGGAAIGGPLGTSSSDDPSPEVSPPLDDQESASPGGSGPRMTDHDVVRACTAWQRRTARGRDASTWPPAAALAEAAGGRGQIGAFCRAAIAAHDRDS